MTVFVCIVTYKARDYLRECLVSLYQNTRLDFEVTVVDNGSNDGTIEMLATEFHAVRLIQNERNEGFTLPMNQAMRAIAVTFGISTFLHLALLLPMWVIRKLLNRLTGLEVA